MDKEKLLEIRNAVHYNPDTGAFVWIKNTGKKPLAGKAVGCSHGETGYLVGTVCGDKYFLHRLAWIYFYGEKPKGQIDHINGVRDDNRICNLRQATQSEQNQNFHVVRGSNIYPGVYVKPSGKYTARIRIKGRMKTIGIYDSPKLAFIAYLDCKEKNHPHFVRSSLDHYLVD